jgi:hypothetical protein
MSTVKTKTKSYQERVSISPEEKEKQLQHSQLRSAISRAKSAIGKAFDAKTEAEDKLHKALHAEPTDYCLAKITEAEMSVESTSEVYERYVKRFKEDFPGVKPSDI